MERLEEIELRTLATQSATAALRASGRKKMDLVKLTLVVNAHATGFCSAARYVETFGDADVRTWWQKLILKQKCTVEDHAREFANQYMRQFPSLSIEDAALIRSAGQEGFRRGYEFRRNKSNDAGPGSPPDASGRPPCRRGQESLRPATV